MNADEAQNPDTVFTCLSIILLCFFLFLNSLAVPRTEKAKKALTSIGQHFPHIVPKGEKLPVVDIPLSGNEFAEKWGNIPDALKGGSATVQPGENTYRITMASDLLFVDGDDQLQPKTVSLITDISKGIIAKNLSVEIQSHTDNLVSLSSRYPSLWTLSIQRAQAVYRLMRDSGVSQEKLIASGFASGKPEFSNETEEGRAKNRRIVLLLSQGKEE